MRRAKWIVGSCLVLALVIFPALADWKPIKPHHWDPSGTWTLVYDKYDTRRAVGICVVQVNGQDAWIEITYQNVWDPCFCMPRFDRHRDRILRVRYVPRAPIAL